MEYPNKLPYQRLCLLYRKNKDYNKELETCNKAIKILNQYEFKWFLERKNKVKQK